MRALTLVADRRLVVADTPPPPPPGAGEVQIRVKAVALNHIDVWGYRSMAFAKRKLPLVVGAEASGEIAAIGGGVTRFQPGQKVVMYGALTCGTCPACRAGRDNLCEADTFNGSLLVLKRGGRLVTCGSTSGPTTTINLMQLFQQQ